MSKRGTFYAVTAEEADHLISLVGDDAKLAQEALELYSIERHRQHFITPVDKTWDAVHRCLTDGTLQTLGKGETPLSWCVLGGRNLSIGAEMIVCYVAAEQVSQVLDAVDDIEIPWFIRQFSNLPAHGYTEAINNEEFEFAWESFTNIRNLYERAEAAQRAVVFVAD